MSSRSFRLAEITSAWSPTITVWTPTIIKRLARIRDWICPSPKPPKKKNRKRIPRAIPKTSGTAPRIVKNRKGLYIIKARIIVSMDFFTYPNMLLNRRELLSSAFVRMGTEVMAILSRPACTMVSSVYVYSFMTFIRMAASRL